MKSNINQKSQLLEEAFTLFQQLLEENQLSEREISFLSKMVYLWAKIREKKETHHFELRKRGAPAPLFLL